MIAGAGAAGTKASKLAIGVGMIPRGEVGLIFATYGLTSGLVDNSVYSALVIVVMLTTFVVPPMLVRVMKKVKTTDGKDEHEHVM